MQVRVGFENLVGEVIRLEGDRASIQVYEETGRLQLETMLTAN
jgi:vacuolar-type H+-ATPase catalytic subunit A/Vma1